MREGTAARTTVRGRRGSYPQVEPRAVDLMTPAVVVVEAGLGFGQARARAARAGARLLATREARGRHGAWSGLDMATLERALALRLDRAPVAVALWALPTVGPRTPEVVVRRRLRSGIPAALVVDRGQVLGAVLPDAGASRALPGSLRGALDGLPEPVRLLLHETARVADEDRQVAWLVGGLVRDLALGRGASPGDLDLVIEGDALPLARRLAMRFGGRVREHPAFLTATLELPGQRRVDLATARRERYGSPGALPRVEPASIDDDLWRRDFSINALAVRLDRSRWGETLDPTCGLDDLARRVIRVLHPLSFVEDPTRCLRAARFAARLGFHLEPSTRRLLAGAARLSAYPALSPERLRAELSRILDERKPTAALDLVRRLGALPLLGLAGPASRRAAPPLGRLVRRTRDLGLSPSSREVVAVLALAETGGVTAADAVGRRLGLPPEQLLLIRQARAAAPSLLRRLARARGRADAYRVLGSIPESAAAWALVQAPGPARGREGRRTGGAARLLARHLRHWRHVDPLIRGGDLRALGVDPGPRLGVLLREARAAQAAGRFRTRAGALGWLRRTLTLRSRPRSEADRNGKRGSA